MTQEILIYGLSKESTQDWQEDLLACFPVNKLAEVNTKAVIEAATKQGFHGFRVTTYAGQAPDFIKTLSL